MAAPTRSRPCASRVANGSCFCVIRSRAVISPIRRPSASTSGSFLILCVRIAASAAAASSGPSRVTSRARGVIRSATVPAAPANRRSRVVSRPATRRVLVDHDQRADAGAAHHLGRLGQRRGRTDRVRVGDDAMLAPLDPLDLAHLRLDVARAEAAVDDADAAFLGDGDRHLRAGDGVHVRRDDRPLQRQPLRTARHDRSIDDGSRRSRTLYCGVKRKSSKVQPRTRSTKSDMSRTTETQRTQSL